MSEEEVANNRCDPELFLLLNGVFKAAADGQLPVGEVVIGKREYSKHIRAPDSRAGRGMLAVMGELRARGIEGKSMKAYMMRTLAFIDLLKTPGEASEFIRRGEEPGHLSFSESLVRACAVADFIFPKDERGRLDISSVLDHTRRFEEAAAAAEADMLMLPELPCPCGSGRKLKHCCMTAVRKPQSISLSVAFDKPVTMSGFGIMPDGAIRTFFATPAVVEQAFIETTYERAKGDKVLHRIPINPSSISLDTSVPLLAFDTLFALDTNTRTIASTRVSVAALVLCKWHSRGSTPILTFAPTQAIELRNTDCFPDWVAWKMFFELVEVNPNRPAMGRVGLIVDAHLSNLNGINSRQSPILDNFFLPAGSGLIYASADVGKVENIANKLLSVADGCASEALEQIERTGDDAPQFQRADVPHTEYFRVWECSKRM